MLHEKFNLKPTFHPGVRAVRFFSEVSPFPGFHYSDAMLTAHGVTGEAAYDRIDDEMNRRYISELEEKLEYIHAVVISRDLYQFDRRTVIYRVVYAIKPRVSKF